MYNVNIFKSKTPDSLVDSIELGHLNFPPSGKNFTGAPECLKFASKKEKKVMAFCWATEDELEPVVAVIKALRYCRRGIAPKDQKGKDCGDDDHDALNDNTKVTSIYDHSYDNQ